MHRLWPVSDVSATSTLSGIIGPKPLFIADGHHRYETAVKYRQEIYESGCLGKEHPANYVLMMFVAMEDPGLAILPTHRLFRDLPSMTAAQLTAKIGGLFNTRPAGRGSGAAREVWEELEMTGEQGSLALYTREDEQWTILELTGPGRMKMAEVAEDHGETWRELGVSLLHRLVVGKLLGCEKPADTKYVHLVAEVMEGLATGEFPLAALVMPATVDHVRAISMQGERMPAKSTYFYPKLLSGLVINPLE